MSKMGGTCKEGSRRKVSQKGSLLDLEHIVVLLVCLVAIAGYYSSVLENLKNQVTEYENQTESITS